MPILNNYPGATAAYALRKLRSDYNGSAVRVRRDNDNAEQDIGFSGNDLDTASLSSFVGSSSAYVTKWYDQSGNSNDTLQTTALSQPRIVNDGLVDTDASGIPTLVFDGSDDFLISADFDVSELTQPSTYFSVAQLTVSDGTDRVLTDGEAGRNLVQVASTYEIFAGSTVTGGSPNTDQHTFAALFDGVSSVLRVDGSEVISGNPGADSIDHIVIGADDTSSQPWVGTISEVIFYNSDQSANFAGIEADQRSREASDMVNKQWRGAIEPAETGANGNEIKLWRGAVEPASESADSLIRSVTRSVTRGLTRGVTEGWSWG